jgi:hypothetical protein
MSGFLKQQAASAMNKELLALERSFFLILQGIQANSLSDFAETSSLSTRRNTFQLFVIASPVLSGPFSVTGGLWEEESDERVTIMGGSHDHKSPSLRFRQVGRSNPYGFVVKMDRHVLIGLDSR